MSLGRRRLGRLGEEVQARGWFGIGGIGHGSGLFAWL